MCRRRILALLSVVALIVPATAQTPLPQIGETIEVSIVNVDVVVTDRRGNHIRGLKASDFEIRDNGVLQPVSNFAEYDDRVVSTQQLQSASAPVVSATAAEAPREPRTIVLFVERQVLPPAEADKFVATMKKLMHDVLRPGDSAAVITFHYAAKVQQAFTSDLGKIDAAIDKLRPIFDRIAGNDVESQLLRNQYMQELLDEDAAEAKQDPIKPVILSGVDEAERELIDMRRKIQTLNILVNTMAAREGRKAVLMATRRFSQYAGYEFLNVGIGPADDHFDTRELRDALAANANSAGVTFYPVYPEGYVPIPIANVETGPRRLRTFYSVDASADANKLARADGILINETKSIGDLAQRTGGVAGWGLSDVQKIASIVREDLSSYYSLAFRAPAKATTHKISVTTKNRSYVVRARREFVSKTDDMQMSDRVIAALYQPQKAASLPVDVQVLGVTNKKHRYHIPMIVRVPAASLTMLRDDKGRSGSFRIYAAAGGLLGIMSDVYQKSQPFVVPAGATDIDTKEFEYSFEMVTDGRADRIVVGVYDELSKQYGLVRVSLRDATAPSPTTR